jgi:hypothetical protein
MYRATDEQTAISMFLADHEINHTDIDSDQITAIVVDSAADDACCGGSCGCDSQA